MKVNNSTIDIIALSSSLLCAIHCAAIPVLVTFSSLGSLSFLENHLIEWIFIGFGVLFVFVSLWPSYKKLHRNIKPLLTAGIGFALIAIGRFEFTELWEVVNTVMGATIVSIAHFFNWQLLKRKGVH